MYDHSYSDFFQQECFFVVEKFFDPKSCHSVCRNLQNLDPNNVHLVNEFRSTYLFGSDRTTYEYLGLTYLQKASLFLPIINSMKCLSLLQVLSHLLGVDDIFC